MFDLEQEIARWRRSMSARLAHDREALEELESHLRDAVQQQTAAGTTPDEAWAAALARLGAPEIVAAEYGKLEHGKSASGAVWRWWPARVVLGTYAMFVAVLGWFVASRLVGGKGDALLAVHVFAITAGYTTLFAVGAVVAWSILSRAFGGWTSLETGLLRATMRSATIVGLMLTVAGTLLGSVWAYDHLGRFWGWDAKEVGAVTLTACMGGILLLLARGRDERVDLLLGLAGIAMVTACWLGPTLVPGQGLHDYGRHSILAACLSGVMIGVVALFGLVFVRPGQLRFWRAE
jgi:hypothetical protein